MQKNKKRVLIEFADYGQDLLYFIVQDGIIIKAGPYHNDIYSGKRVLNSEFKIGGQVELSHKDKSTFIKYPIEALTEQEDGQEQPQRETK
ncbi:hypothetical protein OFY43_004869 [Salmonella enterica]|nr:hypothetical protein [Salmonella enterica]EJC0485052.1 hypothetical protein [Salmonella enterica]EJC0817747.1 hypothetical protein [Salmonella enterica]EJI4679115.1 hypothetical protein [Salmonella enterica]EKP1748555.1 hypothetical protein [Salmonella enterica]